MPKAAEDKPALRVNPVQVAKRKQKSLGHEEVVSRKRSKTAKAAIDEDVEPTTPDKRGKPKIFISPEKYIRKGIIEDDNEPPIEFVSGFEYMVSAGEGSNYYSLFEEREPEIPPLNSKKRAGRRKKQESHSKQESCSKKQSENNVSTQSLHDEHSSTQQVLYGEKSGAIPSDRFVTGAQEDLMQMIEEGASDLAIANQIKIIKLFRTRLQSQEESQNSGTQHQQLTEDPEKKGHSKSANDDIPKVSRSTPAPRHSLFISSDSECSPSSQPAPSPGPKKRGRPAKNSTTKPKVSRVTKELLKTARPASAPTSLPAAQRTNKSLTTQEVASLSKTHPTFDEMETNKLDRHTRKINSTKGMASDRPVMPDRGLESRIRAPTSSPEEIPRGETRSTGGARLNAESLKAVEAAAAATTAAAAALSSAFAQAGTRRPPTNAPPKKSILAAPSARPARDAANTLDSALGPQRMVSRATAAAVTSAAPAPLGPQQQQIRRPGQVFNAALRRWQFVEEVDSDDD